MAQAFLVQKSGGGINQTLPSQITAFVATADTTPSITLSWTNPTDYFEGVLIVKKIGSAPTGVSDGEKVYSGADTSFVDADVAYGNEYFYRAFAYNAKKQYQTLYAVASATPVNAIPFSELPEGTLINIPEDSVDTLFYLAKHDYESGLNGAGRQLMVRKEGCGPMRWSSSFPPKYATSELDTWHNGDYKARFNQNVQNLMGTTTFKYTSEAGKSVSNLTRSIFTPSATEYGHSDTYANIEGSVLPITNLLIPPSNHTWTRSPYTDTYGGDMTPQSVWVYGRSLMDFQHANNTESRLYYTRPCFTLPADALVNPTPNADGSYNLLEVA